MSNSRKNSVDHSKLFRCIYDTHPITINQVALDFVLEIENQARTNSFRVTQSALGDGQLDPYLSIFKNNPKSWITREYISITPPKKQILFANGHYKLRPKQPFEENIMASMIQNYDVIVYKKGLRIQNATKATSIYDLNKADGALVDDVKKYLASQGEACENYYIVDFHEYYEILFRITNPKNLWRQVDFFVNNLYRQRVLDLEFISADEYDDLLKAIDPDKIKNIVIGSSNFQDLAFIQKYFRNVHRIIIKDINFEWIKKYFSHLKAPDIILDNLKASVIHIPKCPSGSLSFYHCENTRQFWWPGNEKLSWRAGKSPKLSCYGNYLDDKYYEISHDYKMFDKEFINDEDAELTEAKVDKELLRSIVLKNLNNDDWTNYSKLTHFVIHNFQSEIDLTILPANTIQSLCLYDHYKTFEKMEFPTVKNDIRYPFLHYLAINDIIILGEIDAFMFPHLRTLIIKNNAAAYDQNKITICLPTLTRLHINAFIQNIYLSECENLETIIIENEHSEKCSRLHTDEVSFKNIIHFDAKKTILIDNMHVEEEIKLKKFSGNYQSVDHSILSNAKKLKYLNITHETINKNTYQLNNHCALRLLHSDVSYDPINLPSQDLQLGALTFPCVRIETNYEPKSSDGDTTTPSKISSNISVKQYDPLVLIYNNNPLISVDASTTAARNAYSANGELAAVLEAKEDMNASYIRTAIYDTIVETIDPNTHKMRIIFMSAISKKEMQLVNVKNTYISEYDIEILRAEKNSNPKLMLGYLEGMIKSGEAYSVLDASPVEGPSSRTQFLCQNADNFEFYWHPKHQHYYFYLKPHATSQLISLRYLLTIKPVTHAKQFIASIRSKVFSQYIQSEIFKRFSQPKNKKDEERLKKLSFLFSNIPLDNKLQQIVNYCEGFKGKDLENSTELDLDVMLDEIIEQKGSCRHRAKACMLLFHFLNCELFLAQSATHAFNNFPIATGDLQTINLGGLPRKDATDKKVYADIAKKLNQLPPAYPKVPSQQDHAIAYYEQKLAEKINIHTLDNAEMVLDSRLHNPLIINNNTANESPLLQCLTDFIQDKFINLNNYFLYIDQPEDFQFYLKPFALINNRRVQVDGPLMNIIKSNGILVINWKNFSAADKGNYKSVLDEFASIKGEFIDGDVHVIGMIQNEYLQPAFESRCTKVQLHEQALAPREQKKIASLETNTINLFNRPDWREPLLGIVEYINKGARIKKGPLIDAMLNGISLEVLNPPSDPDFHILVNQALREGRVFWNNDYVLARSGFSLTLTDKKMEIIAPNIHIFSEEELKYKEEKIYLTNNNFHECMQQLVADVNNYPTLKGGYLQSYDPTKNAFYLTEPIQASTWNLFNNFVLTNFPDKFYHFSFAPGAGIIDESRLRHFNKTILPTHQPIIFTNDPELYLSENKTDKIVFVNSATTYSDLISEKEIVFQNDIGEVKLFIKKKAVLSELVGSAEEKGKNITLCGPLTPTVYHKLLSLLNSKPHIDVNGVRLNVSGRLTLVMPLYSESLFPYANKSQKIYSLPHYCKYSINFLSLKQYISLVQQLPKNLGRGRPGEIVFTLARIKNMLAALSESKLHPQNPVKGLINYDFPKDSEDYAYLNVIGKMTFRPAATKNLRLEKFVTFAKNVENFWRLLNCFSGADLIALFNQCKISLKYDLTKSEKEALLAASVQHSALMHSTASSTPINAISNKFEFQLKELLYNPKKTVCIILGPPGVGKTLSLRNLTQKYDLIYIEGFKNIKKWFESRSTKPIIFGYDEFNLAPEEANFLQGINLETKEIFYEGTFYKLTPEHKIFATGNPAHFPHRFYHHFFQQHGEIIYLKMPNDEALFKNLIDPSMRLQGCAEYGRQLLSIYKLIQKFLPFRDYSYRTLNKFMNRFFIAKLNKPSYENIKETLYKAAIEEFSFSIEAKDSREKFTEEVAKLLAVYNRHLLVEKKILTLTATFIEKGKEVQRQIFIPPSRIPLIKAIQHDIVLMKNALQNPSSNFYYHRCILVEGPIGEGKSVSFQFLLKNNGFSLEGEGSSRFYVIHANDPETPSILLTAFHEGSKVILEELNANKQIEILLNQLLEGVDDQGQPSKVEGFMVFASQNPSIEAALSSVSSAAKDRMHVLYMDPISDIDIALIATAAGVNNPAALSQAHKNKIHQGSNTRFVMQLIHADKKAEATKSSQSIASNSISSMNNNSTSSNILGSQSTLFAQRPQENVSQNQHLKQNVNHMQIGSANR